MAQGLEFGIERSRNGSRLTVTAPDWAVQKAREDNREFTPSGKVGGREIFKVRKVGAEATLLALNAKALGRVAPEPRTRGLNYANGIIDSLSTLARLGKIEQDPRLGLMAYYPTYRNEFGIEAELALSSDGKTDFSQLTAGQMLAMAKDIGSAGPGVAVRRLEDEIGAQVNQESGIQLTIGNRSSVQSSQPLREDRPRVEVTGNQVAAGEQPLIYLAALTLLATLADK